MKVNWKIDFSTDQKTWDEKSNPFSKLDHYFSFIYRLNNKHDMEHCSSCSNAEHKWVTNILPILSVNFQFYKTPVSLWIGNSFNLNRTIIALVLKTFHHYESVVWLRSLQIFSLQIQTLYSYVWLWLYVRMWVNKFLIIFSQILLKLSAHFL